MAIQTHLNLHLSCAAPQLKCQAVLCGCGCLTLFSFRTLICKTEIVITMRLLQKVPGKIELKDRFTLVQNIWEPMHTRGLQEVHGKYIF